MLAPRGLALLEPLTCYKAPLCPLPPLELGKRCSDDCTDFGQRLRGAEGAWALVLAPCSPPAPAPLRLPLPRMHGHLDLPARFPHHRALVVPRSIIVSAPSSAPAVWVDSITRRRLRPPLDACEVLYQRDVLLRGACKMQRGWRGACGEEGPKSPRARQAGPEIAYLNLMALKVGLVERPTIVIDWLGRHGCCGGRSIDDAARGWQLERGVSTGPLFGMRCSWWRGDGAYQSELRFIWM